MWLHWGYCFDQFEFASIQYSQQDGRISVLIAWLELNRAIIPILGGDLDGDLYFVCWNQDLLPRKPNFPPMDYQTLEKLEQLEPITAADITKFLVNYIRFDQLGVIDNAHKALADQENDGVESEVCLHLAKVHSSAVDAPKTGKLPKMQGIGEIKAYPDFMMKRDKPSYPSDKVLGKLYRRCRKFQDAASEKFDQKMRIDKSLLLQGNDRYIEEARESYQQYRDKMQALMSLYGIESEAEVFTGCFLKLRNRLSKEKTEIAEIVGCILFEMRLEFRNQFFHDFNVNGQHLLDNEDITDEMLLKASAWYNVAYTHAHDQANESEPGPQKRLLGFPWFVNDIILAIKNLKQPHHFSQSLDVNTTVGESVARLFNEEKTWILEQLLERVRTKKSIAASKRRFTTAFDDYEWFLSHASISRTFRPGYLRVTTEYPEIAWCSCYFTGNVSQYTIPLGPSKRM